MRCVDSGPAATKADLVILGDGYADVRRREKFVADARRASDALFESRTRSAHARATSMCSAVWTPAGHARVSRGPRAGVFRDSPLGARYNSFDSERYVLSLDDRAWRDAAAARARTTSCLILVNERKYGGGEASSGCTPPRRWAASFADYLVVHEFGHHFAGLGDEYYTSPVAYEEFAGGLRRTVGAQRHRAARARGTLKWKPIMVERGDAAADAVGEGGVRGALARLPEAAAPSCVTAGASEEADGSAV